MEKTDLTYLHSMSGGNYELILEMIDIFIAQAEEIWIEMQELYTKNDYDSLGKLAHKAKSSVAIMGMAPLSLTLKDFELDCQNLKNIETYQSKIDFFKSECLIAIEELQKYKNNQLMQKK